MEQLVRTFDSLGKAQQARDALVSAGFASETVQLSPTGDEAGAVKGNFTVGDVPEHKGGDPYKEAFQPVAEGQRFIMTVAAPSPSEADRAAAILEGHGAQNGDPGNRS